jgi:sugar O-acyltransferase (sialic acid O-acetyltransferase NeuD family)
MNLPTIVIGAGGHARVLISVLKTLNRDILGVTDLDPDKVDNIITGFPVLGSDNKIMDYSTSSVELVNGIGAISSIKKRKAIYIYFKNRGYSFAKVIHPSAIITDGVRLGEGVQVMAGAIIQSGCIIGNNSIVNTGAIIDHDCMISEHVHVAPGAVLSGGVRIGTCTHIGTSATIIQGVEIGQTTIVGAGAVVLANIPSSVKAIGVPAKIIKERE